MTTGAGTGLTGARPRGFAAYHRWDHAWILFNIAAVAIATILGFGREILEHQRRHDPPYPLIVDVQAAAFMAWLGLLTVQARLIHRREVAWHRRLGLLGAGLSVVMVILGVAVSLVVGHQDLSTDEPDPSFLAIRLADVAAFAGLAWSAIALRGSAAAHKRLILLATLAIADAGFSRLLAPLTGAWFNAGFWPMMGAVYLGGVVLVLALGAYDLVTRRRLHPIYPPAVAWIFGLQMIGIWLYLSPWWTAVALKLLGGR